MSNAKANPRWVTVLAFPEVAAFLAGLHPWERTAWAHEWLEPCPTDLVIVWEDPAEPEAPAKVTHPDPHCMAELLFGGLRPPAGLYHQLQLSDGTTGHITPPSDPRAFIVNADLVNKAAPLPPLTEEQAMEWMVEFCLPRRVWDDPQANAPRFIICRRSAIPADRTWRNAWRMAA